MEKTMAREFSKLFYKSKEWQKTREYILKRDLYLCVKCGKPAEEVHHKIKLTPSNMDDVNITMNPDNLVSLCKDCHFKEHEADKIQGIRKTNNIADCDNGYEFDSNGFLVQIPPVKNIL
jgi:5-methylcytosine-specific restriction endonuclease McrA